MDPQKFKIAKNVGRPGMLFCLAWRGDSGHMFYGCSDSKVYDLDLAADKAEPVEMSGHQSYVTGLALAGDMLISGGYDGKLIWWNAASHEKAREVEAHARWIRGVAATPDGKTVASVADDMICRLWDASSGKLLRELKGHAEQTPHHYPSMLYACAISHDGRLVATGDRVGHVKVWELSTGKPLASLETPVMYTWDPKARRHSIGGIRSLAFSHDGKSLAVGGMGKVGNIDHLQGPARIEVFDWAAGKRTHELASDKFKGLVECLAFDPQGQWLVAAGGDNSGFLMFIDLPGAKITHEEKAPMHVHEFALNEAADTLCAVGHGRVVRWSADG